MTLIALKRLALSVAAATAFGSAALAESPMAAEDWTTAYRGSDFAVPACDSPDVLSVFQSRFSENRTEYWNSDLKITGFDGVKDVDWRPWGLDFIPRRFCKGTATMSDGNSRQVVFSVVEGGGAIGYGWGVRWCVVGLDPSLAYSPECKQAAP